MAEGIKVKVNFPKAQAVAMEKAIKAKFKLVENNIAAIIQKEALPYLIDLIMKHYDTLSERMSTLADEDPTNPANWRNVFKTKLEQEASDTFIYDRTSGRIKINLGEKSFLGYSGDPDNSSDTPLVWMVYYLEGLAGSWAWITRESYQEVFPSGKWSSDWGRFANAPGFMLSGIEFFDEDNPWKAHLQWAEVKHPFSAFSPLDIFAEALNEFQIRPFVNKAIKASLAGKKL
jgi:hypothetical protein